MNTHPSSPLALVPLREEMTSFSFPILDALAESHHPANPEAFLTFWLTGMGEELRSLVRPYPAFFQERVPGLVRCGQITGPLDAHRLGFLDAPRLRGSFYGHLAAFVTTQQPLTTEFMTPAALISKDHITMLSPISAVTHVERFFANVPDLPGRTEKNAAYLEWFARLVALVLADQERARTSATTTRPSQ